MTNQKEQKAQQAQTKSVHGWLLDMQDYLLPIRLKESIDTGFGKEFGEYLIERCRRAESIVDSQAQKIAEQAKEIERLETTYDLIPLDAEQQRLRS